VQQAVELQARSVESEQPQAAVDTVHVGAVVVATQATQLVPQAAVASASVA